MGVLGEERHMYEFMRIKESEKKTNLRNQRPYNTFFTVSYPELTIKKNLVHFTGLRGSV